MRNPCTLDDLGQLVLALQPAPGLGRRHHQLEHHEPGGVLRQRTLGADGPMPDGGEHALDRVRRAQVVPGSVKSLGRYAASWIAWWPNRPSSTAALT